MAKLRLACCFVVITAVATAASAEERPEPTFGRLAVEGQFVQHVVLDGGGGRIESISDVNAPVMLRAGHYRVQKVSLKNGFTCPQYLIPKGLSVTVEPNQTATLKVGSPLQHRLDVKRQGPLLVLSYRLLGQGGEAYDPRRAGPTPPGFVVRREGITIDSGQFKFG